MIDRREQILARIRVIFDSVPGVSSASRNREDVSGGARPALFLNDQDEEEVDLGRRPGRRNTKTMMSLAPQILLLLGARSDVVGTSVSQFRASVISLIWKDDTLWDLVGQNGDIRYTGCVLDTTAGGTREAQLEVKFEFTYVLDANELES